MSGDLINSPAHYTSHPSGVEAITVAEQLGFNRGNAWKYLMRWEHKGSPDADLMKAAFYCRREAARMRSGGELVHLDNAAARAAHKVLRVEPLVTTVPMTLIAFPGETEFAAALALNHAAGRVEALIAQRAEAAAAVAA